MPATAKNLGIDQLPIDEQLALVEEIWDGISESLNQRDLNEHERAELDRRLANADANPDNAVEWSSLRESMLSKLSK